jgi:DNA-binding NarL/FixJ family response regulator
VCPLALSEYNRARYRHNPAFRLAQINRVRAARGMPLAPSLDAIRINIPQCDCPHVTKRQDATERKTQVIAAYQAGHSSRAVAAQFGIADAYVRQIVKRAGVARPRGKRT